MEYKRFNDTIIARLDPGDEVLSCMTQIANDEGIQVATVEGIGAVGKATIGLFDTNEKQYHSQVFEEPMEITSLLGSITHKDGEPYLHLHINVGNADHDVHGGHLNEAVISATGEIFIRVIDGKVGRTFSDEIGLNLFKFD